MSWGWRNSGRSTHAESNIVYWGVENINTVLHIVQWAKLKIFVCIRPDCKITDSYGIGYSHLFRRLYEDGRFDVLRSVGISLIFKLLFAHVQLGYFGWSVQNYWNWADL